MPSPDSDLAGNIFVAAYGRLVGFDTSGQSLFNVDPGFSVFSLVANPSANELYVVGFTENARVYERFSKSGTFQALERSAPGEDSGGWYLDAAADGWRAEFSTYVSGSNTVWVHDPGNPPSQGFDVSNRLFNDMSFDFAQVQFDPAGNVLIAGTSDQAFTYQGTSYGTDGVHTATLFKLSRSGQVLWAKQVPHAHALSLGISPAGTAVMAVQFSGTLSFGGGSLGAADAANELALLIYESAGTERTAVSLGTGNHAQLAVSAPGRAYVATAADGCAKWQLRKIDLSGQTEWSRPVGNGTCASSPEVRRVVSSAEGAAVIGPFAGTSDFGTGPVTAPSGGGTFIWRVGP